MIMNCIMQGPVKTWRKRKGFLADGNAKEQGDGFFNFIYIYESFVAFPEQGLFRPAGMVAMLVVDI